MQNKTDTTDRICRIDRVFFLVIILILLVGLLTTVFYPHEINYYENRYANKPEPLTADSYADGSFQDGMESALADQVQLAQHAKKFYNCARAYSEMPLISLLENSTHDYVYSDGMAFYGGKIVYTQSGLDWRKAGLEAKAENLNAAIAAHPELEFYAYYIEKDTDIDFTTGQKLGASQFMLSMLNIPDENKGIYEINSFSEFDERFYDTDHHWNYIGSYEGYRDVLSLMSDDKPLEPTGVFHSGLRFAGSKAMSLGSLYTDEMSIYCFDYPPMEISIEGEPGDYGHQSELLRGELEQATYVTVYGSDDGEVIFDTGRDGDNLLVIGESYDNAILKLLASHFSKTCSIDLRNYENAFGEKFDFDGYVRQHGITKVLFIGNVDFYVMDEFMI